jgi:hypothetical protein
MRTFVVGCPRSGTTLLQSLLAGHSRIASFPETHFFEMLFGRRLLTTLGIAGRRAGPHWQVFLETIGHPEMYHLLPKHSFFIRQFSNAFVRVLDTVTLDEGKSVWLEKTPGHLRFLDRIETLVPGARFVHVLRNGLDTIGSLYEMGQRYPERWGPGYGTLDKVIERWVVDMRLTEQCARKDNHRLVRYEQLVADPRTAVMGLCEFLGVPFEERMLTDYPEMAAQVTLKWESWKAGVRDPIRTRPASRSRLDEQQMRYVLAHLPKDLSPRIGTETTLHDEFATTRSCGS